MRMPFVAGHFHWCAYRGVIRASYLVSRRLQEVPDKYPLITNETEIEIETDTDHSRPTFARIIRTLFSALQRLISARLWSSKSGHDSKVLLPG